MKKFLFLAAVLFQIFLLGLIPMKKVKAYSTGREILLSTTQYDPDDPVRGYYVTMDYEISRSPITTIQGDLLMVLNVDSAGIARPGEIVKNRADIPENALFIKGRIKNGRIDYGLDRFYIPENRTFEINDALRDARSETDAVLGIARIDSDGSPVLVGIRIKDVEYRF